MEQFKEIVGDDQTVAFKQSGKTFKDFKKELLRKFHPDLNGGSEEANTISQEINNWEEPIKINWQKIFSAYKDCWSGPPLAF